MNPFHSFPSALLLMIGFCIAKPGFTQTVTFSAVGDIFFGRGGNQFGTEDPFRYVKQEFQDRDVVLGNLETPICAERYRILTPPCSQKKGACKTEEEKRYRRLYFLTFQARVSAAKLLKDAGFTLLSTANNHVEDQGGPGINETLKHLSDQKLAVLGSGKTKNNAWRPYIFEKDGVSIGVVAATTILNFPSVEKTGFVAGATLKKLIAVLPARIEALKQKVDFVVVTMHYGVESTTHPDPRERKLLQKLSDAGADVFIGTHPHVLQGIEKMNQMVVFWSLGNFLFDSKKNTWRESGIVHIDFVKDDTGTRMENIRFLPVTLSGIPSRLPIPANPVRATAINKKVIDLSRRYRNPRGTLTVKGNQLIVEPNPDNEAEHQ